MTKKRDLISVVIPVFCEAESISTMFHRLQEVTQIHTDLAWEYIFVNDGSTDNSWAVLLDLAQNNEQIKVLDLSCNHGKELAMTAGLYAAKGDALIFLDADLQHPPNSIHEMLRSWQKGSEVVVGVRKFDHHTTPLRRFAHRCFYGVMNKIAEVEMLPRSTDFRLIDKKVAEALKRMPERQRLFRSLIDWLGFKRSIVEFEVEKRFAGRSTFSRLQILHLAIQGILSHSLLPLWFIIYLGIAIVGMSSLLLLWMQFARALVSEHYYYTPLAKFVVFNTWLMGLVLTALGITATYIGKIYQQILGRPLFTVRQAIHCEIPIAQLGAPYLPKPSIKDPHI